jgi:hypothetical protein
MKTVGPRDGGMALAIARVVVAGAIAAGCSYDPHPANGKLACSADGQCPQGYSCQSPAGLCYADGAGGSGGSVAGGTGGAPSSTNVSDYVGNWMFGNAATIVTSCNDGLGDTTTNIADHPESLAMSIVSGGGGGAPLLSSWLCDLQLDVDSTGGHLDGGNHTCAQSRAVGDPASAPLTRTWTATRFDFNVTKRDRNVATHVGEYDLVSVYSGGGMLLCHQVVRGGLQKL